MSWYEIHTPDVQLGISGILQFTFTCPRCKKRQTMKVGGTALLFGVEVNCTNCGTNKVRLDLSLNAEGIYKPK